MAYRTIFVVGEGAPQKEALANAAITPGEQLELLSTDKVQANSTADVKGRMAFAIEDDLQGKGIDDDYAADDRVRYKIAQPGHEVNAILAASQTIVIGDKLTPDGNGHFKKVLTTEEAALIAREAVTTTASTARILAEAV